MSWFSRKTSASKPAPTAPRDWSKGEIRLEHSSLLYPVPDLEELAREFIAEAAAPATVDQVLRAIEKSVVAQSRVFVSRGTLDLQLLRPGFEQVTTRADCDVQLLFNYFSQNGRAGKVVYNLLAEMLVSSELRWAVVTSIRERTLA